MASRTEAPTRRRLLRARQQGDLPISTPLVRATSLLVGVGLAPALLRALFARTEQTLHEALHTPVPSEVPVALARDVLTYSVPILLAAVVAATAVGLLQTAGSFHLGFFGGAGAERRSRMWRDRLRWPNVLAAVSAFALAGAVAWMGARLLLDHADQLGACVGQEAAIGGLAQYLACRLAGFAVLGALAIALVHLAVVRGNWLRRLRMTRAELRHEVRLTSGDPSLRAARRRVHESLVRQP